MGQAPEIRRIEGILAAAELRPISDKFVQDVPENCLLTGCSDRKRHDVGDEASPRRSQVPKNIGVWESLAANVDAAKSLILGGLVPSEQEVAGSNPAGCTRILPLAPFLNRPPTLRRRLDQ